MTNTRPYLLAALPLLGIAVGVAGSLLWHRGAATPNAPADAGKEAEPDHAPGLVIALSKETVGKAGIETAALARVMSQPTVEAFGALELDPSACFVLRAPIAGLLQVQPGGSWPALGASVDKGSVVGSVAPRLSPIERADLEQRLLAADLEIAQATTASSLADAALQRTRALNANDKNASDREVEEATARAASEQARLANARLTRTNLDGLLRGTLGALPITAAGHGEILAMLASPGENVDAGQELLRVGDPHVLLARVMPPIGIAFDAAASAARVHVGAQPPLVREARIIGRSADGSLSLHIEGDAAGLRPAMPVTALLPTTEAARSGFELPSSALVRHQGQTCVFVQKAGEADATTTFELRVVPGAQPTLQGLFAPVPEHGDILHEGELLVVQGSAALLSHLVLNSGESGDEPQTTDHPSGK